MRLSCYVPSQIIPKSRVVHLADKQILKTHTELSKNHCLQKSPGVVMGGGGGGGGSIPGPWLTGLFVVVSLFCFLTSGKKKKKVYLRWPICLEHSATELSSS